MIVQVHTINLNVVSLKFFSLIVLQWGYSFLSESLVEFLINGMTTSGCGSVTGAT